MSVFRNYLILSEKCIVLILEKLMLKIYIARHGQNEDNANGILNGHRDFPLTKLGEEQAFELAEGIKEAGLTFDVILSSPLVRAFKTAEIISDELKLSPPEKLEGLIERDFGVMTGVSTEDIEKLCAPDILKTNTITYFLSPKGAETFPELLARGKRTLEEIKEKYADGCVLLVCHGDIGKMIYTAYYNLDWMWALTTFHFGNSELLLLAEDSKPEDSHVIHIEQHNH
jgi:broad specificity phosphatase PhoE